MYILSSSSLLFSLSFGVCIVHMTVCMHPLFQKRYMEISSSHGVMVLISYLFSKAQTIFYPWYYFYSQCIYFEITGHRWTTGCVVNNTTSPISQVPDSLLLFRQHAILSLFGYRIFFLSLENCPFDCNSCLLWVVA